MPHLSIRVPIQTPKHTMRILVLTIGILLFALAWPATADTTLVFNAQSNPLKIRIQPGAVRIDHAGPRWQLYLHDENAIYMVYPESETYTRIDKEVAATISKKLAKFRRRIEEKLAELPPERRQLIRSALAQQLPMFRTEQHRQIIATEQTTRVADQPCRILVVKQDGTRVGALCMATRDALGLSRAGFAALQAMYQLLRTTLVETGLVYRTLPNQRQKGIPIRYTGRIGQRTLARIDHEDLPDSLFQLPSGYQQKRAYSGG